MVKESKATEVKRYTIQQFYGSESIAGNSISSDGRKVLFSGDKTGIYNAYCVSVEDGVRTQLTHSEDNAVLVSGYFPMMTAFCF